MSSTNGERSYEVFEEVPLDVPAVGPGTNLLVSGPPMTGKRELAFDVLAAGSRRGQGALITTTETSASSVAESFGRLVGDDDRLAIVDAHGNQARSSVETPVRYASSPS